MMGKFFVLLAEHFNFMFQLLNHRVVIIDFFKQFFKVLFQHFFFPAHGFQRGLGLLQFGGQPVALAFQRAQAFGEYRQLFFGGFGAVFLQGGHFGFEREQFALFGFQAGQRFFLLGGRLVEF